MHFMLALITHLFHTFANRGCWLLESILKFNGLKFMFEAINGFFFPSVSLMISCSFPISFFSRGPKFKLQTMG